MRVLYLLAAAVLFLAPGAKVAAQMDQDAMMKAWTAYMTPGDMHQMLAKESGDWDMDVSMWMEPNAQPMKSKGSCTNKMVLGDRYQESRFTGEAMGKPMEGVGTTGYDNAKKEFVSTWIDNMGTGVMMMTGKWDEGSKTINFTGNQTDPMSGKDMKVRETYRYIDNDNHVMEMYMTPEGGTEFKTMEITFKRK